MTSAQPYNEAEARLQVILRLMNGMTFGLRKSEKIVGGRARLEQLIVDGKVRAEKSNAGAQNGKWFCNASDVLRHAKL